MKKICLYLILSISVCQIYSQSVPKEIIHSFEKGNAKELSKFFNHNIEIKLPDKEYVTSSNQAMRILQDFFRDYPPTTFNLNYKGDNSDIKYGLGILETKKGEFRVNLYFLNGSDEKLIYYLSIEEKVENEKYR